MTVAMHVVLEHPEIHWNTGNAGRTCLAVGAQLHLVEPLGFRLDEREVRRAGLDYWPRVQPRVWPDWKTLEDALPGLGEVTLFHPAAHPGGHPRRVVPSRTFWDLCYPASPVLVFGRESGGLPS